VGRRTTRRNFLEPSPFTCVTPKTIAAILHHLHRAETMTQMMNSVAAVIPSWNTAAYIERCLDSLDAQAGVSIETIVVDNGSTDASLELIKGRGVNFLSFSSNIGFAAAVNTGAAETYAPLVLVLNADCYLASDCLRRLVEELTAHGGLGGVQPRILQEAPPGAVARIYSTGQCLARRGAAFERGWGEPDGPRHTNRGEVFGVSGAACLLRRELFADVGGYDVAYFAFFEDVDLNARARLAGWRFAYVPDARATHVGHAAWRQEPHAQRFVVELTVRNRLATAFKVLPVRGVVGSLGLTLRSIAGGPLHGTSAAVLTGTLTALRWLPRLLGERRRLRSASPQLLDDWLALAPGRGPNPADI
jgi:GT2 family glycosyltransferase